VQKGGAGAPSSPSALAPRLTDKRTNPHRFRAIKPPNPLVSRQWCSAWTGFSRIPSPRRIETNEQGGKR